MTVLTLSDLTRPLQALRLLAADFPRLPAPCPSVSTVFPDVLALSVYDDFAAFEAWRDALNIAPEAVVHRVQSGGRTAVLKAATVYAGARVELVGYSSIPAADPARAPMAVGT
ncbi:hypothetical protein [Streptomyces melanogenes]|uniref:hypothetical protein n=1 Tax=Streptomyces melanogenes TaxID=67326 RepID=UPI00167CB640|nr:hypothetical protein [Streptomyces melanogenes]GGP37268.1 hypothetical protein GCM10010278_12810 [Streptomyces melanogenes]